MKHVEEEQHRVCGECGATIYKEHLDQGIARYADGKLLCPPCLVDFEKAEAEAAASGMGALAPIEFDDGEEAETDVDMSSSRIQSSSAMLGGAHGWDDSKYKRPLDTRSIAATRCRLFHSKLTASALDYMSELINGWLDENENITIKFSNSTIGLFEGKHAEPHIVLTLFY